MPLKKVLNYINTKLIESSLFKSFVKKEYDGFKNESGNLSVRDLHLCLLELYTKINLYILPARVTPPTKKMVDDMMQKFDADSSGQLDFKEFYELSKKLFGITSLHRSIPVEVILVFLMRIVLLPFAAWVLHLVGQTLGEFIWPVKMMDKYVSSPMSMMMMEVGLRALFQRLRA